MEERLIPAHGGYRDLKSFQATTIVYDLTVDFCDRFIKDYRMKDQMVQAARSGRQNIAEGSQASGTSKKTELKLIGVARASQEELLLDYEDFLRQRQLEQWGKDHAETKKIRSMAYLSNRSYTTYRPHCEQQENAANVALCLIHQANYLLDLQLAALEEAFVKDGGFTERLYKVRTAARNNT